MANSKFQIALLGNIDFTNLMRAEIFSKCPLVGVYTGSLIETRQICFSERPDLIVIEIGSDYSSREHSYLRGILSEIRSRLGLNVLISLAITRPDRLFYAGDLLFLNDESLESSLLVDQILITPPTGFPSTPSILNQLINLIHHSEKEMQRRVAGKVALPSLGSPDWVMSMADPISRELWMQWLPRYATYTNESPIITGPTGTGKTRLAAACHLLSGRKGPFISITPRDFSSSELVQAELFGAVSGAFTGAVDRWGLVKSAEKGSLFIDELQSIDKDLQGKLITFIENKIYRRVGSPETVNADVRFLFATNRPISAMVTDDTIREDFAYRLERVELSLPPLKDRPLDIPAAIAYCLAKIKRIRPQTTNVTGLTSDAYRLLFSYSWPGNLRQLENVVAQLCEVADIKGANIIDDNIVTNNFQSRLTLCPATLNEIVIRGCELVSENILKNPTTSIDSAVTMFSNALKVAALEGSHGDPIKAAELLGHDRTLLDLYINK